MVTHLLVKSRPLLETFQIPLCLCQLSLKTSRLARSSETRDSAAMRFFARAMKADVSLLVDWRDHMETLGTRQRGF